MNEKDRVELRSEKVRNIIGEVPSSLMKYGILVITCVVMGLLIVSYFIPYPETISCQAVAENDRIVSIYVPYKYLNEVSEGEIVRIEFEGYSVDYYNYRTGKVVEISKKPLTQEIGNVFLVRVRLSGTDYEVYRKMSGTAFILIDNKTILQHIINL